MKSKLDKNSKLSSGKSKEVSSSAKSKPAANSKAPKPAPASSTKKAKAESKTSAPKTTAKAASSASKPGKPAVEVNGAKSPKSKTVSAPAKSGGSKSATPAKSGAKAPARSGAKGADDGELTLEEFSISLIKPGETKERIWRTKSFQQHPAQREFGFPDVAPELPGSYSEPKLVLMPKDPEYMFCYWELTPSLIELKEKEKLPSGSYRETLKINWESKSLFEPNFTFIPVFFWARKWYFGVPQVGQRYQVELGWLSDSGHFISIIRSNLSELPESWASTQKRLADQGEVLAFSSSHTKILGSSEQLAVEDVRAFVPEWNLSSESMTSSSWSRAAGDGAADPAPIPQAKASKSKPATPKAKLEVSGKVLPGTLVYIGGNAVAVDAQGVFKTEFPYQKDVLNLELASRSGASRSFTYDLKELVLT